MVYSDDEMRGANTDLKLLAKYWGNVTDFTGKFTYASRGQDEKTYETKSYLRDRDTIFGSRAAWDAYLTLARGELETAHSKKDGTIEFPLRDAIEPNKKTYSRSSGGNADWKEAQDVFYAWTRKGAEKVLIKRGETDVNYRKLAMAGSTQRLLDAIAAAAVLYKSDIKGGQANFRPMKGTGIRLGTISDHGFGTATDIDDVHNPIIKGEARKAILTFTGIAFTNADRADWWNKRPKEMYDKIALINSTYIKKIAEGAEAPAGVPSSYAKGFFTLPWELVSAMHTAGFLWGATFEKSVDLHHFELKPVNTPRATKTK